jgi:glycosyltransferase involved in cell wall biosynthesis
MGDVLSEKCEKQEEIGSFKEDQLIVSFDKARQQLKVSIVIPCKAIDASVKECISKCLEIEYPDYEILVLPDFVEAENGLDKNVHVIPTGYVKPLTKRFMAITASDGDVCALIDSDAYPVKDWLKNAQRHFSDSEVAAVVGPSLTPDEDDLMARASGLILASPLGGGSESIRYSRSSSQVRYVTESPTCNLIIRKSVLDAVKDSVPDVWPGEEIALCGAVTKGLKKRIVYDPQVVVYHHRRKLFIPHLKQIWNYGAVKGYLLKKYSRYVRPVFFLPSLLVLGIVGCLPLAALNQAIGYAYVSLLLAYFFLTLGNGAFLGFRAKSIKIALLVSAGTIATHICYGLSFIKGIFSRKL